jgi:oligosaccharide repeat unit polymerase
MNLKISDYLYVYISFISAFIFFIGYVHFAIGIIFIFIFHRIFLFRLGIDISNTISTLPFIISLIQLLSVLIVYLTDLPPLTLSIGREVLFEPKNVVITLFCTSIQTLFMSLLLDAKKFYQLRMIKFNVLNSIILLIISFILADRSNDTSFFITGSYAVATRVDAWGGWVAIYVIVSSALLLQLPVTTNWLRKIIIISLIIQILYFLAHGNRSEVLIQLLLLLSYWFGGRNIFFKRTTLSSFGIIGIFLLIILFYVIGEVRDYSEVGIFDFNRGYLYLSTLSGSMWSQIAVTGLYSHWGTSFGTTYISYLINIIPSFIPTPWERGAEVAQYLFDGEVTGGMGFWGEAYLNFGIIGVVVYSFLFVLFNRYLLKRSVNSYLTSLFLLSLLLYLPRIYLYDFVYLVKILTFFSAAYLLFGFLKLNNRIS